MSQIKGLFFDLGGTLFSYTGRMGGGGVGHLMKALNLQLSAAEVGQAWREASAQVGTKFGQQNYFLHKDLFRDTVTTFLSAFDKTASDELLETFHQKQLESMLQHLPIRDECHDVLQTLKSKNLYLSIVSNIDDDYLFPLVEKHKLDQWLDHWTSSEEAQSCKPDPDIYHYCLDKAGLHKDEVLFVGDSLHHDVAGAAKVGMRSARIVEPGVATPLTHGLEVTADPTYEISSLTDLIPIVDAANGHTK